MSNNNELSGGCDQEGLIDPITRRMVKNNSNHIVDHDVTGEINGERDILQRTLEKPTSLQTDIETPTRRMEGCEDKIATSRGSHGSNFWGSPSSCRSGDRLKNTIRPLLTGFFEGSKDGKKGDVLTLEEQAHAWASSTPTSSQTADTGQTTAESEYDYESEIDISAEDVLGSDCEDSLKLNSPEKRSKDGVSHESEAIAELEGLKIIEDKNRELDNVDASSPGKSTAENKPPDLIHATNDEKKRDTVDPVEKDDLACLKEKEAKDVAHRGHSPRPLKTVCHGSFSMRSIEDYIEKHRKEVEEEQGAGSEGALESSFDTSSSDSSDICKNIIEETIDDLSTIVEQEEEDEPDDTNAKRSPVLEGKALPVMDRSKANVKSAPQHGSSSTGHLGTPVPTTPEHETKAKTELFDKSVSPQPIQRKLAVSPISAPSKQQRAINEKSQDSFAPEITLASEIVSAASSSICDTLEASYDEQKERAKFRSKNSFENISEESGVNPTTLSRYILDMDWENAEKRCNIAPIEARTIIDLDSPGGGSGLPLHLACLHQPPVSTLHALLAAYPEAAKVRELTRGNLPLHLACLHDCSVEVVELLINMYSLSLRMRDSVGGNLPLHVASYKGAPVEVIRALFSRFPGAITVQNKFGLTPVNIAINEWGGEKRDALISAMKPKNNVSVVRARGIDNFRVGDGRLDFHFTGLALKERKKKFTDRQRTFIEISVWGKSNGVHDSEPWRVVYRSEPSKKSSRPSWKDEALDLELLCDGDFYLPMKVSVYACRNSNSLIGSFQATLADMIDARIPAIRVDKKNKKLFPLRDKGWGERGYVAVVRSQDDTVTSVCC